MGRPGTWFDRAMPRISPPPCCAWSSGPEDLSAMGERGRRLAVERFDVRAVNATILDAMGLAGSARRRAADAASGLQTSTNRQPLDAYQHEPSTPIAEPVGEG